jgi:hypothetical protein
MHSQLVPHIAKLQFASKLFYSVFPNAMVRHQVLLRVGNLVVSRERGIPRIILHIGDPEFKRL